MRRPIVTVQSKEDPMDKQTVAPGLPVPTKPRDMIPPGALPRGRGPDGLQDMSAAYFGLVMATGIVSLACAMMGLPMLGDRKSVVKGKSVSVRVDFGGRRNIQKKKKTIYRKERQKLNIKQK